MQPVQIEESLGHALRHGSGRSRRPFLPATGFGWVDVDKLDNVRERDRSPTSDHIVSVLAARRFNRHDRTTRAYDDRAGIENIDSGVVAQAGPEWLEWLVVKLIE